MSLGKICRQFHPIAFPNFPLHMQKNCLLMISLLFYNLQNKFNKILVTDWTVRGSNSDGSEIFRTCLVRPCGHPATCTMSTVYFQGVKSGQGVALTPHHLLVPWSLRGKAIPLLPYGPYGLYKASVPVQGCTLTFS